MPSEWEIKRARRRRAEYEQRVEDDLNQYGDWLTPVEAGKATRTSESNWRNKAAAGKIPGAVKKGKQWLLPRSSVQMLAAQTFHEAWLNIVYCAHCYYGVPSEPVVYIDSRAEIVCARCGKRTQVTVRHIADGPYSKTFEALND